jgi:hypothetical protein
MDFTELGPLHGSKPAQVPFKGQRVEKQDDPITTEFRVKLKKRQSYRNYLNRMYGQFVVNPTTMQPNVH